MPLGSLAFFGYQITEKDVVAALAVLVILGLIVYGGMGGGSND